MITLLHTNDVHGHLRAWRGWEGELQDQQLGGAARLASAIAAVRAESPNLLLMDAGDLIGDTMIAQLTHGQALTQVFDALQYDAVVIGNHEPDFGGATLMQRIESAGFATLAANVRRKDNGELLTRPYMIKDYDGVKVGVFGLAYPKTPWTTAPKNVQDMTFDPEVDVARKFVNELRNQGVDLVIALTHLGLGADIQLAKQVRGIDVIVGGHSHNRMHEARRVGQTLIVQAGAHGSDLGRLDLFIEDGRIVKHRRVLYPLLASEFNPDPAIHKLVEQIIAPHRDRMDEPIGEAASWLIRAQTLAGQQPRKRDAQSPVDSLFADILRETTSSDVALLPGVGYGVAIPPGPITAAQLRQLVPHEGKVVTMQLSGSELREILEQAVENVFTKDLDKKVGGMIQVSGMRFRYDRDKPLGERVEDIHMEPRQWSPERKYRVATNSMLAAGGHHQQTFTRGRELQEHGSQYEMIKTYFQKQTNVSAPHDVRIRKVDKTDSPDSLLQSQPSR
ncbi:bifunctional UDP-sugar hydrolase/5'-nucleotidase [Novipirellula caenicola]|uniref:Trifunctional nucleotide phosphoesterase protein YfkN n=1 Tax=Novipirellula caenicola TaxID=1536901 RepID=A0ABP9W1R9_9BACT